MEKTTTSTTSPPIRTQPVSLKQPVRVEVPASMRPDRPFFILGCPRSGTSLLTRLLNEHSRLCVPHETQIFPHFVPLLPAYGDLTQSANLDKLIRDVLQSDRMQVEFEGKLSFDDVKPHVTRDSLGGVFEAVLRAWAKLENKSRWGEKTPQNANVGDAFIDAFPDARYIHIVRDGRDVGQSLRRAMFGPKSTYRAAQYWNRYLARNEAMKERLPAEQWYELRYVDLLHEPEQELRKLCDFLGETFEMSMLDYHKSEATAHSDPRNTEKLKQPIQKSNAGKWKKNMSPAAQRVFEALAGDRLRAYGFETVYESPSVNAIDAVMGKYITPMPRRLAGMMKNKKAQREFLYRLSKRLRLS